MVAPVRCATPGTDVDCAAHPSCSATSTIQSASTPPPCPPMARMAMASGFSSKTGGEFGAASFIGAAPLSNGRGVGDEGSPARLPHPSRYARHLLLEGEGSGPPQNRQS